METISSRRPVAAHSAAAYRHDRAPVFTAFDNQSLTASLVCRGQTRRRTLSIIRLVEFRLAARPAQLSGIRGTHVHHPRPGLWMVRHLRFVRLDLRSRGMAN